MPDYSMLSSSNYDVTLSPACPAGRLSKCGYEIRKHLLLHNISLRQAQTDRLVYMNQYPEIIHSSLWSK